MCIRDSIDSARIGGTVTDGVASGGIYIANQTGLKTTTGKDEDDGLYITGLTNKTWNPTENGYVSGRAATEDQLQSAISQVTTEVGGKPVSYTHLDVYKRQKVATAIAIGENTFVRTGGLMIGTHNYRGALGDVDVDSANIRATGVNVNSTTLGTNSYNSGAFATIVGAYSIASGNYASGGGEDNASKNLGATIVGS